ncbi:MAG: hypothetical protein H6625_10820 [Bdellovibrionaceae bacterium]|nr:hypothetical protein [Pseudobdellovibrionaceae bacterium]
MLKNSYNNKKNGKTFEDLAIQYFLKKGFQLKNPKLVTTHIQVDALFYKASEGWLILEVKSLPQSDFDKSLRVSKKQAKRLHGFLMLLSNLTNDTVRAHLAIVSHSGHIELYEDFLCDLIET